MKFALFVVLSLLDVCFTNSETAVYTWGDVGPTDHAFAFREVEESVKKFTFKFPEV